MEWIFWRPVIEMRQSYIEVTEQWTLDDLVEAHALMNVLDRAKANG